MPIPLTKLTPGQTAKITFINATPAIRQRILDMGLIPGATVTLERTGLFGRPFWIGCNGTSLALRQAEAEGVEAEVIEVA